MQARRQPASHRLLARRNGETRGCKIRAISQWEKPSMRLRSYFLRRAALGGQAFSASFRAERNEQQADRKGDRGHGDRSSQRAVAFDAGAHEKCYPGACKTRERGRKGKCAGAALRRILLRQPERVHGEIGAAQPEKEKTDKKPRKRGCSEIENLSERQRNGRKHQREINPQRAAAPGFFREPRHHQAAKNRRAGNQHRRVRSQPRCRWSYFPGRFRQRRHRGGHIDRSRPQTANRCEHIQGIQNRSAAQRVREKGGKWPPDFPGANHAFLLSPPLRLRHAMPHPGEQKRRQSADRKHRAPAEVTPYDVIRQRCKKGPNVVSRDRKSTRLNSSHGYISYAVFCLKKKNPYSIQFVRHRPALRPTTRSPHTGCPLTEPLISDPAASETPVIRIMYQRFNHSHTQSQR